MLNQIARLLLAIVLLCVSHALSSAEDGAKTVGQQVDFRPLDSRPTHDDARLASLGIHRYESRRLVLYTDIDGPRARAILPVVDQAYDAWEEYFGKLLPAPDKAEFQMTGYVLRDEQLFEEGKLIPDGLPPFVNGRHRQQEFWIKARDDGYYLTHLVVHEATHCFMTIMPDTDLSPWYLEGMAELFGTHQRQQDGRYRFRVLPQPDNLNEFQNWERINIMKFDIEQRVAKTLEEVVKMTPNEFGNNASYAWSWGLCEFLDAHPRYQQRFRELGRHRGASDFAPTWERLFGEELYHLRHEWLWFIYAICPGYDWERTAVDFVDGKKIDPRREVTAHIVADRGWQSSGVRLEAGQTYRLTAGGRVTLASQPRQWISEPQGISIRYNSGEPLGRLMGVIEADADASKKRVSVDDNKQDDNAVERALDGTIKENRMPFFAIGKSLMFSPKVTGTLYLRVNDACSELADNEGEYTVAIEWLNAIESSKSSR